MNQVLIEQNKEVPLAYFRWIFLEGAASDTRAQEGLNNYALELFRRGSKNKDRRQINQYLAEVCSSVSVQVSDEMSTFAALLPSQSLEAFSNRLVEVVQSCDPNAEEMDDLKKEIVEEQKVSLENPLNLCSYLFRRAFFEDDSYGNFIVGNPSALETFDEALSAKKRNDLLAKQGYLVMGGDVDEGQGQSIATIFNSFSDGSSVGEIYKPYQQLSGPRLALCHDPNQDQATVIVGWSKPRWTHEEYMMAQLLEKMLSREYSSLLCQTFRQRAGLTYGVYGSHRLTLRGSQFVCRYQTASKFAPQFLEDLLTVFDTFSKGEGSFKVRDQDGQTIEGFVDLSNKAIDQCRTKIINSMPFLSYSPQAKLARRLEEIFYDSPVRDEKWMKKRYLEVKSEELQNMSQQLFEKSGFVVAIVDNMEKNGSTYRQIQNWTKVSEILEKKSILCGQI